LVQAEAPPNALFSPFKQIIRDGGAQAADVAFYFTHWLTDLAGAVPTPLEGAEKFVLKFPHAVLNSFIKSFGVLNELAHKSETEVLEDYLIKAWREVDQQLGPVPTGNDAIALMRLVVQAQEMEKQIAITKAFAALNEDDRKVLADEMARTGISEQRYAHSCPQKIGGPVFLVYYSPSFIRNLAPHTAGPALVMLAEVYRRSRKLWPLRVSFDDWVTVRIDQIKELSLTQIQAVYSQGESWLLYKRNEREAVVERHDIDFMTDLVSQGVPCTILKFYRKAQSTSSFCSGATTPRSKPSITTSSPRSKASECRNDDVPANLAMCDISSLAACARPDPPTDPVHSSSPTCRHLSC